MKQRFGIRGRAFRLVAVAALAGPAITSAQPSTIPRFDFSFSNPGARSLGFGGAFAALADDATAAYANPAGLVQLVEPEVALEVRQWSRSPAFIAGGRLDGQPTGRGIDTQDGLVRGRDDRRDAGPSFAAVVLPRGRWSFAIYGHQLAKFEERSESQGFFTDETDFLGPRLPAFRERVAVDITSVGGAAGWRINDRWSLGLGLVYSDLSLDTRSDLFFADDDGEAAQFERISFLPARGFETATLTASGTDLTLNAGFLGRITDQLSASLFYRQGAKVRGRGRFDAGPASPFPFAFSQELVFRVPDVSGAGLAYRSRNGAVTLTAEVDRVGYQGLIGFIAQEDEEVEAGREYRDATEYHLGGEYALLSSRPLLAFRAGYWVEANGDDQLDRRFDHLAAGVGLVIHRVQLDLAADFSDEGDTLSVSFILNF